MIKLPEGKIGEVRLLENIDHKGINPYGGPVVGWSPMVNGHGGILNARGGWALPRVVIRKEVEGKMQDIYDQPMIVEKPGSIVVCTMGDKVAVIANFRMTGPRPEGTDNNYIQMLEDGDWKGMLENLGEWRWELPAGLADIKDGTDIKSTVLGSAQAEALEEAGLQVVNAKIVGKVNMNPTFFPHDQYVVRAEVASIEEAQHEDLEMIGGMQFVDSSELRQIVSENTFVDAKSIAALAIAGIHF